MDNIDPIVMKSEIQPNGDILLFYVEDNQDDTGISVLDENQQEDIQMLSEAKYVIEDSGESESADELDLAQASDQYAAEQWLDEEIRRLIVFYLDNKETFQSGTTKKKHLWAVACKTMLLGRQPLSCEYKLRKLREQYFESCGERQKGNILQWPFYNLCHQAFNNENQVDIYFNDTSAQRATNNIANEIGEIQSFKIEETHTINAGPLQSSDNANVEKMLQTYIQWRNVYKNNKGIWEKIAMEMGAKDVEYWQKRFLNYKQYYACMLLKRDQKGPDSITWPYMKYFDEIFANDVEFENKYTLKDTQVIENEQWHDTEKTFLIKYFFDCFHEFQDPTIPDDFLWHEVGRLLNKEPNVCKDTFEDLKKDHYRKLLQDTYVLGNRVPIEIIFDCIISKETEIELEKPWQELNDELHIDKLDVLVQFISEHLIMFKDSVGYYVCWALAAKKINCGIPVCRKQWQNLTALYKNILIDKKENPDLDIDWRYIDAFEKIFDHGNDVNLLNGYDRLKKKKDEFSGKVGVKKITMKDESDAKTDGTDDEVSFDEGGFTLRTKRRHGEEKATKILDYYLKNKDKFNSPLYKKLNLWEGLANKIGVTPTECAHRFRNLKQVYIAYVQREMSKPEMPITWPYYAQCKKVFGYRVIKAKYKNKDLSYCQDWTAREIKKLLIFYGENCDSIDNNIDEISLWDSIAEELGQTPSSCSRKFFELRKSYKKLKTMKANNPETKISWKYFSMMDEIYLKKENRANMMIDGDLECNSLDIMDDDEYQCIIVIPEGEDISKAREIGIASAQGF
ncbi:uncharacterized protein LOC126970352 [Leptidea sinapis]|uniref:uncharacterized protein LOC126970352 n=1 Tax=Leptidea sinapis TaxID=189913 RepID=UPI0021C31F3C|nr:uncharacterized protein LOC126970352 [Leptidea sinapis]